jgi:hypothetical protein
MDQLPPIAPTFTTSVESTRVIHNVASPLPLMTTVTTTTAAADGSSLIVNELLLCVQFYRGRFNNDNVHETMVNFFLPADISDAKCQFIGRFHHCLDDCPFRVTHRQSQTRSAYDAETEDIIGMFHLVDSIDSLRTFHLSRIISIVCQNMVPKSSRLVVVAFFLLRQTIAAVQFQLTLRYICNIK